MKLSTGKVLEANRGIIGLNSDMEVHGGYDEILYIRGEMYNEVELTVLEQIELADYMIGLWTKYKETAK